MSTIFHQGRMKIRQLIGSRTDAEVADFLFAMIFNSRYKENGQTFFLLPHMQFLADKVGLSVRHCRRIFKNLIEKGYIRKVKTRCYDGAVRLKVFFTAKFRQMMTDIGNLSHKNSQKPNKHKESDILSFSERDILSPSYIREEKLIENNQNVQPTLSARTDIECENTIEKETVSDCFSASEIASNNEANQDEITDLANIEDKDEQHAGDTIQEQLTPIRLSNKIRFKDVCSHACQLFTDYLGFVPYSQRIALSAVVDFVKRKGRLINEQEVYQWLIYMLLHQDKFFSRAKDFKHWCNIVIKQLKRNRLNKPNGFDEWLGNVVA